MAWFKRKEKELQLLPKTKWDVPKGLWYKSPTGKIIDADELEHGICRSEDSFVRIGG
jgi:acetyl-CoA carboxylase carboxyl transferase subunit beta